MAASGSGAKTQSTASHRATVLVVDDDASGRDLLKGLLESQGYTVVSAASGEEALELADQQEIDLALLDVMMPRMDGVEVCIRLRRNERYGFLPVVFITSLQDRASRIRAKEAGADDILTKPLDALELFVRVESLLRGQHHAKLNARERERLHAELTRLSALVFGQPGLRPRSAQPVRQVVTQSLCNLSLLREQLPTDQQSLQATLATLQKLWETLDAELNLAHPEQLPNRDD